MREAARHQGFPDGFRFSGTMSQAFKQIGNAVSPLMSAAITEVILTTLKTTAILGSTGRRNGHVGQPQVLVKRLGRCLPAEGLARSGV